MDVFNMSVIPTAKLGSRNISLWSSLLMQCLRICLPTQGRWVCALVQEGSKWRDQLSLPATTTRGTTRE